MKWPRLPGSSASKKVHVKVKILKLEGLRGGTVEDDQRARSFVLKMKWKGPRSGLASFYRTSTCKRNYSGQKFLKNGECQVEWDDEFESICDFWIGSKDKHDAFDPWDISFTVLHGEDTKSRTKLAEVGRASMNIAGLASRLESDERRLPISLKMDGASFQASLWISVGFAEVRNSNGRAGIVQNSAKADYKEGFFKKLKSTTAINNKSWKGKVDHASSSDSDEYSALNSDGSAAATKSNTTRESDNTKLSSGAGLGTPPSSTTRSDSGTKKGSFSWKNGRLSFRFSSKRKSEPLFERTDNDELQADSVDSVKCGLVQNPKIGVEGNWEYKELFSRDGQARLKANVCLASFDQRGEKAAGESACAAIVAVIADWLSSNQGLMPTLPQFDSLITEGSANWRKLCGDEAYTGSFPDNHFDLETVLKADLCPLTILHEKSFTGVFSPENFENLKGAMSFDDIWEQICSSTKECNDRIYIVSWNDHFFVLKAEAEAYYIIDSLGERLFEGCNQAYILKFDDSAFMYGKVVKNVGSEEETTDAERSPEAEQESEELICKGKECCREFIKRFFAAILLGELKDEEKKGSVSTFSLLQRLQIDFHRCSSSPSTSTSSSSSSSSVSSPLSSEGCAAYI